MKLWQFNAHPEKKLEFSHSEITKKAKDEYDYIAKVGAAESIAKTHTNSVYKSKAKAFRKLLEVTLKKQIETDKDSNLEEKLDLVQRQNALMEEIRTYKEENEHLINELDEKDRVLKESNDTVSILSLRINYMITQKFLVMSEKVW